MFSVDTDMTRVALYLRQSKAHPEGIDRQRDKCAALVASRGWTVVAEYTDDDVSASKARGPQTGWGQMLAAIASGTVDTVVAVDLDRLLRTVKDLLTLSETGVKLCTVDGELDLTSADGEFRGTMLAGIARFEVRRKSERQKRANAYRASLGKTRSGGVRPFGWDSDGVTLKESEAVWLRYMFSELLAGTSINALTRDLNSKGVPTSRGSEWSTVQVKKVLLRERNAGLLIHEGQVMPKSDIAPAVSVEDFELVRSMLAARATPGRRPEKAWLSGLLTCSTCGGPMVSKTVTDKGGSARTYVCRTRVDRAHTDTRRHVTIRAELAEFKMHAYLYGAFGAGRYKAATPGAADLRGVQARLVELAEARSAATDALLTPGVDKGRVKARLAEITAETEKLEGQKANLLADSGTDINALMESAGDSGDTALAWLEWFKSLPLEKRRDIVRGTYTATVMPGGKGAKRLLLE